MFICNRPYALASSRRHVGGRRHCLVRACDLLLVHRWQLHLRVILYPPSEGAMRLWHHMQISNYNYHHESRCPLWFWLVFKSVLPYQMLSSAKLLFCTKCFKTGSSILMLKMYHWLKLHNQLQWQRQQLAWLDLHWKLCSEASMIIVMGC